MAAATPRAVLLDIEGTVCPISFVKDVLFPYALAALPSTLATSWDSPSFAPYRNAFPAEHAATPSALTAHVRDLMCRDVKIGYLKSLQGHLWAEGYASGALLAPLFPDVAPQIRAWHAAGTRVVIYSSGSVAAQRMLFGHTTTTDNNDDGGGGGEGKGADLTPLLSGFWDTLNAGPKTEAASYARIAAAYPEVQSAEEWLFLSDNVKEVEAAQEAGMQSFVVQRPGNAELAPEERGRHRVVTSLEGV